MNPLRVLLDTTPDGRGTDWYPHSATERPLSQTGRREFRLVVAGLRESCLDPVGADATGVWTNSDESTHTLAAPATWVRRFGDGSCVVG